MNKPGVKGVQEQRQSGAAAALLLLSGLAALGGDGGDWRAMLAAVIAALLIWGLAIWAGSRGLDLRQSLANSFWRWPFAAYLLLVNGWLLAAGLKMLVYWWAEAPPAWLLLLLISLVYGYGAYRGEAALQRMAVLVAAMLFFWTVLDTLLLLPEYDLEMLRSLNQVRPWQPLAIREALWLLAPIPALLVYLPGQGPAGRFPAAAVGTVLTAAYLILARLRDQAVLGLLATLNPYPLVRTLSMVSAGVGLNRVEYFGLLALFGALFTGGMLILGAAMIISGLKGQKHPFVQALLWTGAQFALALLFYLRMA